MRQKTLRAGVDAVPVLYGNALIHRARNTAVAALRPEAGWALFIDDDMMPPSDSLLRLLEHRRPVISAVCTTRREPVRIVAKVYDPASDQFAPILRMRPDSVIEGPFALGAAFLLVRRDVLERVIEYYLSAQDWVDENLWMHRRLHVRKERLEAERKRRAEIRRARYEREKYLRIFRYTTGDDELELGEDISFAKSLLRLGIPTAIDTGCKVGHLGEKVYGVWDVIEERERSLEALAG